MYLILTSDRILVAGSLDNVLSASSSWVVKAGTPLSPTRQDADNSREVVQPTESPLHASVYKVRVQMNVQRCGQVWRDPRACAIYRRHLQVPAKLFKSSDLCPFASSPPDVRR
jgi:hypothetical protein